MDIIKALRGYSGVTGKLNDPRFDEIVAMLLLTKPYGYSVEIVENAEEEKREGLGVERTIFKVTQGDRVAYFKLWRWIDYYGNSDGAALWFGFGEVIPVTIHYKYSEVTPVTIRRVDYVYI